jgi:hypothetical protein
MRSEITALRSFERCDVATLAAAFSFSTRRFVVTLVEAEEGIDGNDVPVVAERAKSPVPRTDGLTGPFRGR